MDDIPFAIMGVGGEGIAVVETLQRESPDLAERLIAVDSRLNTLAGSSVQQRVYVPGTLIGSSKSCNGSLLSSALSLALNELSRHRVVFFVADLSSTETISLLLRCLNLLPSPTTTRIITIVACPNSISHNRALGLIEEQSTRVLALPMDLLRKFSASATQKKEMTYYTRQLLLLAVQSFVNLLLVGRSSSHELLDSVFASGGPVKFSLGLAPTASQALREALQSYLISGSDCREALFGVVCMTCKDEQWIREKRWVRSMFNEVAYRTFPVFGVDEPHLKHGNNELVKVFLFCGDPSWNFPQGGLQPTQWTYK